MFNPTCADLERVSKGLLSHALALVEVLKAKGVIEEGEFLEMIPVIEKQVEEQMEKTKKDETEKWRKDNPDLAKLFGCIGESR